MPVLSLYPRGDRALRAAIPKRLSHPEFVNQPGFRFLGPPLMAAIHDKPARETAF